MDPSHQTKLLSIIVPVYNMAGEGKLARCLDSLLAQTILKQQPGRTEILAVDDASTDDSLRVLRDYEERSGGVLTVIASPENRKQGGAKNLGLAAAQGEWIGFIDADDWVSPDYYERLLAEAERTGADMAGCDYSLVDHPTMTPGERVPNNDPAQAGMLDKNKYQLLLLDSGSLVVKIYRRRIIFGDTQAPCPAGRHGTGTFPEGIFYEDNAVAATWMLRATNFAYLPEPLYFYYQHGTSTVHTLSESNLNDRMEAGRLLLAEAEQGGYLEAYRPEIEFLFTNLFYRNTLFSAMAGYRTGEGPGERRESVYRFTKRLAREMRDAFPRFYENPYYRERIDAEERGFMELQMRSQFLFYIKYRLLWKYRRMRAHA